MRTKHTVDDYKNRVLLLACAVTICTQMLDYYSQIRMAMLALWLCWFLIHIVQARWKMQYTSYFLMFSLCYVVYTLYSALLYLLTGTHFDNSAFIVLLYIPLLMYWVGTSLGSDSDILSHIGLYVAVAGVLLAIYLNKRYMITWSSWMANDSYLYASKNSAGQIFAVTGIWLLFYRKASSKRVNLISIAVAIFFLAECTLYQCRTAMVGVVVAFMIYVIIRPGRTRNKVAFCFLCGMIALWISSSDGIISQTILHAMKLDNSYVTGNLSSFTSGRGDRFSDAIKVFVANPLFGIGIGKVDNLYLCSLLEGGLIGAAFVLLPWFVRIWMNWKRYCANPNSMECVLLLCLTGFYVVESMGESIPPYGPGTCSILFWILCGYVDRKYKVKDATRQKQMGEA